MKIFSQCVFEGYISGTANVYSDSQHNMLLGTTDQLSISGYTAQVTGTGTPNLTVQVEQSFDNIRWQNRNTAAEIAAATLSTSTEQNVQGQDGNPTARPTLPFVRLRIALGGTTPAGQVRLWVTGRDRGQG